MHSTQEAALLRQQFWTSFGLYMAPVLSAEGEKINWVNYKTGVKQIFLKMQAVKNVASVSLELHHKDPATCQLYFQQLVILKKLLVPAEQGEWHWQFASTDEYDKDFARVYLELQGVSILRKSDWPAMISFFKKHIILLDHFWSSAKYSVGGQ